MKIALILCPFTGKMPSLGIASIYAFLKKDFEVEFFDFNINFYTNVPVIVYNFFDILSRSYTHFERAHSKHILEKSYKCISEASPRQRGILINKKLYNIYNRINHKFIDRWTKELLKTNPNVICFSCFAYNFIMSLILAENIKRYDKKIIIIFGGPQCSLTNFGWEIIKKEFVDFVVVGEGEQTIKEILTSLDNTTEIKRIPGVLYKKDNIPSYGGDRHQITNLDVLPYPQFSILALEEYPLKIVPLSFSRGCLYKCAFCNYPIYWGTLGKKSVKRMVNEMLYIKINYRIDKIRLGDNLVNHDHKLLERLCDELIRKNANINWFNMCRLDKRLTFTLLQKMNRAGCTLLWYGLESGSPKVLKKMHKLHNIKTIENIIKNTYKANIEICTHWIIGFPNETQKDFFKTLRFIWKNRKYLNGTFGLRIYKLLPGTEVYNNHKYYGIKDDKRRYTWKTKNLLFRKRVLRALLFFVFLKLINKKIRCDSSEVPIMRFL